LVLEGRGIAMSVPQQVGGLLLPDGQFQWGDATYNVEVECSTVAKAAGQVVRNVKKGRAAGHRVLIALPEQATVSRTLAILDSAFPGMRLWPDGVGLVWKEGRASFRPIRIPGTRVWPFLDSAPLTEDEEFEEDGDEDVPRIVRADTDPLARCVRWIGIELMAQGRTEATTREIRTFIPPAERPTCSEHHIGCVLSLLGAPSRRIWVGGSRPRVYDLRPLSPVPIDGSDYGREPNPDPSPPGPVLAGRVGPDTMSPGTTDEKTDLRRDDRPGPAN
jgi:hypothetical protein